MKLAALVCVAVLAHTHANATPPRGFIQAIHTVEASGRIGPIIGDGGQALGPLQIHRNYWRDARVPGKYEDCAGLDYSRRVVEAYLKRYAPNAWRRGDVTTLARIHNGGPQGHRNPATVAYARKVRQALK